MSKTRAKPLTQLLVDAKRQGWASWIRGPGDEHAVNEGCYFDIKAAERVRNFFRDMLVHSKGKRFKGKPFELLDWQYFDVLGPLYGWKRKDGTRRYRRAYVEIPKKNGKSTIAAGVSLYMLVADGEPGAHVFSCAADKDQAGLVYDEAANMAEASDELLEVLKVRRSNKLILFPETNSKYEAISSDADSSEGKDAHALICDELHVWRGRKFYDSLRYAGAGRDQPLLFMITTAGDDLTTVCYEEHEKSLRIIKGEEFQDSYFAYVAAADPKDDWKDPATWAKANPSLGDTIDPIAFAEDVKDAESTPTKENAFKRYRLNMWIGAANAWLSMDDWSACVEKFDETMLYGNEAWGGMDLSRTRDLSATVWLIPHEGLLYFVPRVYIPREIIKKKEDIDKVPYLSWVQQKFLNATDGNVIDYGHIRRDVNADYERFAVVELGYDPHNAEHLCNQQLYLEDGITTTAVPQTMTTMGRAADEFERLLKAGQLRFPDNPVLTWAASGCVQFRDSNGNGRPIKGRSTSRIDSLIACIIALSRYLASETRGDFYETNDLESG